jgi:hypothetical protein
MKPVTASIEIGAPASTFIITFSRYVQNSKSTETTRMLHFTEIVDKTEHFIGKAEEIIDYLDRLSDTYLEDHYGNIKAQRVTDERDFLLYDNKTLLISFMADQEVVIVFN